MAVQPSTLTAPKVPATSIASTIHELMLQPSSLAIPTNLCMPLPAHSRRILKNSSQQRRFAECAAEAQEVEEVETAHLPLRGGPLQLANLVLAASPADAGQLDHDTKKAGPCEHPCSISGTTLLSQQGAEQPADMKPTLRAGGGAGARQDEGCGGRVGGPACSPGTAAHSKQIPGSTGRVRESPARSESRAATRRYSAGSRVRPRQLQADQAWGGLPHSSAPQMPLLPAVEAVAHAAGEQPVLASQDRPEQVAGAAPPAAERRPSQLKVSLCDRGEELATVSLRWDPSRTVKSLQGEDTGQLGLSLHPAAT